MKTAQIYIYLLIIISCLPASDIESQLRENRDALQKVRNQIGSLKQEITRTNIKTSSFIEQIKLIDREMGLITETKRLLNKEVNLLSSKMSQTRNKLKVERDQLAFMKEQHARRAVYLYKHSKLENLELLFSARSFNQALVRLKYLQFFSQQERRLINGIRVKIENISQLEQDLSREFQEQKNALAAKDNEHRVYLTRKSDKQALVKRLQWDQITLQKQLKTAEAEYQKLFELIAALERQRKLRERRGDEAEIVVLNESDFRKNKGRLPWPLKGKIIHHYGRQRDPRLKTTINNTGIDIRAASGTQVKAIFTGIVSMITYLSGYGNTIILEHGGGYYSVYSHLEEVLVEPNELIDTGQVIGMVGESGSLEGPKLHFALFANQNTENPQTWLR